MIDMHATYLIILEDHDGVQKEWPLDVRKYLSNRTPPKEDNPETKPKRKYRVRQLNPK